MNFERFETDGAVQAAVKLCRDGWDTWVVLTVNRIQHQLAEAADIPPLDETLALAIIEKMGDAFELDTDGEAATVALGEVLLGVAQLAANHDLAISPILDLARVFTHRGDIVPLNAPARLARAVGLAAAEGNHTTPAKAQIVGALAMCVAKTLDDVEVLHDVRVKPDELLVMVGGEVLTKLAAAAVAEAEQASGQGG